MKGSFSKGQSQLIGVVLLTLIMITMIGITYMWGMPLIEKQKDTVKTSNAERLMKEINEKIQSVMKNGGTQRIENPNVPGTLSFVDNGTDDIFRINLQTTGTDIATGKKIYLIGNELEDVPLGSEFGAISVFSEDLGNNNYDVTMELVYRNVTGSKNVYLLDLIGLGRESVTGEGHRIVISEATSPEGPQGERAGKDIYVTKINVRFE